MSHSVDFASFERNMREYGVECRKALAGFLRKGASRYATTASRWVPPYATGADGKKVWKKTIGADLYHRTPLYLEEAVKTERNTIARHEFVEKLREGYRYVVKARNKDRKLHWYYKRKPGRHERGVRIRYRGLMKFLFGGNLPSIGEELPPGMRTLLGKSPRLSDLARFNVIEQRMGEDVSIKIKNYAWNSVGSFADKSRREGETSGMKEVRRLFRNWEKARRQA